MTRHKNALRPPRSVGPMVPAPHDVDLPVAWKVFFGVSDCHGISRSRTMVCVTFVGAAVAEACRRRSHAR